MQKQRDEWEQELAMMKREKRRLDDLLTIREGEVAQMRERLRRRPANGRSCRLRRLPGC